MNDLDPVIVGDVCLPTDIAGRSVSYVACDAAYFKTWLSVLSLDPNKSFLSRCICVYVKKQEEIDDTLSLLSGHKKNLLSKRIFLAFYTQPSLESWLASLPDAWARSLRINYIRCSRYKVSQILQKKIFSLSAGAASRYYVFDADHICIKPLRESLANEGIAEEIPVILAWNSQFYNDSQYPSLLKSGNAKVFCAASEQPPSFVRHAKPYITVKAGFMGIMCTSPLADQFVDLLSQFAFGGPGSLNMRMFHFYYADQLAIHMSLDEIQKDCGNKILSQTFSFIDLASSMACNLFSHKECSIYMPKGKASTQDSILSVSNSIA